MQTETLTTTQIIGRLIMAPLLGGLFAMFLPFIGIAMVLWYGGKKLWELGANVVLNR